MLDYNEYNPKKPKISERLTLLIVTYNLHVSKHTIEEIIRDENRQSLITFIVALNKDLRYSGIAFVRIDNTNFRVFKSNQPEFLFGAFPDISEQDFINKVLHLYGTNILKDIQKHFEGKYNINNIFKK